MAHIINLPTFKDERGSLTVVEKILPFEISTFCFKGSNSLKGSLGLLVVTNSYN